MTERAGVVKRRGAPRPMIDLAAVEAAAGRVYAAMPPTPQYAWPLVARRAGREVWVKHENHTPIGAFKVRGGLNLLAQLASRAAAPAGRHQRDPRQPRPEPRVRRPPARPALRDRRPVRQLGREERGDAGARRRADRARPRFRRGARTTRPGAHATRGSIRRTVRARAGRRASRTYALELFRAVADVDTVYVPIGCGSGICGLIGTRDALGLATKIVGVVSSARQRLRAVVRRAARRSRRRVPTRSPTAWRCAFRCRRRSRSSAPAQSASSRSPTPRSRPRCARCFSDTHQVAEGRRRGAARRAAQGGRPRGPAGRRRADRRQRRP